MGVGAAWKRITIYCALKQDDFPMTHYSLVLPPRDKALSPHFRTDPRRVAQRPDFIEEANKSFCAVEKLRTESGVVSDSGRPRPRPCVGHLSRVERWDEQSGHGAEEAAEGEIE